jgi:hypothetical protein
MRARPKTWSEEDTLAQAGRSKRESRRFEFKEKFSRNEARDWCELIKDLVAIANSGGGCLMLGTKNDGTNSGWDAHEVDGLDPAHIVDKVAKYTGVQHDFQIVTVAREWGSVPAVLIPPASAPIVFIQPGTYEVGGGKQNTAFGRGTVYFRHGAKSEPANPADMSEFIARRVEVERVLLMKNMRKVVEAPPGSHVAVVPREVTVGTGLAGAAVRLTADPEAPAVRGIDPDQTHPYRQKEVVERVNAQLGARRIMPFDIQCVRKAHDISRRPEFYYEPRFSSPQYSDAFVEWVITQARTSPEFFTSAREATRAATR